MWRSGRQDSSSSSSGDSVGLPGHVDVLRRVTAEGYDYEFSPAADERFICPVCMLVMRRAVQTTCGHRFCDICIRHWIRENANSDCPTCKHALSETQLFPDNFANREINSLTVKCPNTKLGCTAVIELRHAQNHVSTDCLYTLCPCPNRCAAILSKKDIDSHQLVCQSRKVACPRCGESLVLNEQQLHAAVCPQRLETCPLCRKKISRSEMVHHEDVECALKVVACFFEPFGCEHRCTREKVGSHMDAAKLDHIHLLGAQLLWLRQNAVLSTTSDIVSLEPSELEPPTTARGTSLTTSVADTGFVTQGTWGWGTPGWGSPGCGTQGTLTASSWVGPPVMSARIKPPLAAMSEPVLPGALQGEYERTISALQRTVAEQNVRIAALEQKLGDPDELIARQNVGSYVWTITDVERRRTESSRSATVHSPCFYTSQTGYKLCLRVNLNGVDSGSDRYVAIFVHVNRGSFDAIIDWPFAGTVTLRIVDQSDDPRQRQHLVESLETKPGLAAFQRPTTSRNHRGFGFVEFAPLSILSDPRYVRDDQLVIHAVAREASQAGQATLAPRAN